MSTCERTVAINFDRDERELMARDTFVVLTGDAPDAPPTDGRRVGDVYLAGLDPGKRTFEGAWYFTGDALGWRPAARDGLRAHSIAHPVLASRILSISPDGTSVHWAKRDTIVRRERRARTLSRSQPSRPTTPPPAGARSAPVSPRGKGVESRPTPLFGSGPFMFTPGRGPMPQTPRSPHYGTRVPSTPPSSRSARSMHSPMFSTPPRWHVTPDTSFEISPTALTFDACAPMLGESPKYTVPQKRGSCSPEGITVGPLQSAFVHVPSTPSRSRRMSASVLMPVHEDAEPQPVVQRFVLPVQDFSPPQMEVAPPPPRAARVPFAHRTMMRADVAEFVPFTADVRTQLAAQDRRIAQLEARENKENARPADLAGIEEQLRGFADSAQALVEEVARLRVQQEA